MHPHSYTECTLQIYKYMSIHQRKKLFQVRLQIKLLIIVCFTPRIILLHDSMSHIFGESEKEFVEF